MQDKFLLLNEEPKEKYKDIENSKVFVGCIIKTEYDEKRIKIKENLNPNRIKYKNKKLYGCLFEPNDKFKNIFKGFSEYKNLDLYVYDKILKENNFSCEENFAYFKDGLYPIDTIHISEYMKNFNYGMFFEENEEIPLYQRIKAVNMFLIQS